jgi:hypothetical protein
MTASARLHAEITRRDVEIEGTESRQRLVILSAERRTLLLALELIRAEHAQAHVRTLSAAQNRRTRSRGYMSTDLRLCAALREKESA